MEKSEKECEIELIHSLQEWGLNSASSEHVTFRRRAVRDCVAYISKSAEPIDIEALKGQKFPTSYSDAYEYLILQKGYPGNLYAYRGALRPDDIYPEPYRRLRSKHTGEVYDCRKKAEYKRFTSEQLELDPLYR
jgi:hypothetical protein